MKKRITLLVVFTLLLGLCAPVMAFEDTVGIPEENAIDLLYALGIVDGKTNKTFDPEGSLTRGEAAVIVSRLLNGEGNGSGICPFTDVTAEHWAFSGVSFAYDMGIINGMTETTFCPDDILTYEQAVKMVLVALGYKVKAEAEGGYPAGYLALAGRLDLLRGVRADGEHFTRAAMARLAANALDIVPFVRASYGHDTGKYEELTGETLSSYYLKVYKFTGIVGTTYYDTVFAGTAKPRENEIVVGNEVFEVGKTDARTLVGQKVNLYAEKNDGDTWTILHIVPVANCRVITVQGEDVLRNETTSSTLSYETEDGRKDSVSIANTPAFVHNGIPKTTPFTAADLLAGYGEYILISNSSGSVDVILYNAYNNYTVKNIDRENQIVYFKEGGSETLDKADNSVHVSFTDSKGEEVSVDACKEWDILSIAKSTDGSRIKAVLGQERVEGTISEMRADSLTIEGKSYTLARNVKGSPNLPKPGDKVIASLDYAGHAAAFNTDTLTENYAFLVAAEATKGLDPKMQVKLFTMKGKMETKTLEDKILYKGSRMDSMTLLNQPEIMSPGVWSTVFVRQLITIEENGEGKITAIQPATVDPTLSWEDKLSVFSMDFEISAGSASTAGRFIGGDSMTFAGRYRSAAKTILFVVPPDSHANEDKMYSVKSNQPFEHNGEYGNMKLYDVDKDNNISVAVQTEAVSTTVGASSQEIGVVAEIGTMMDAEGNVVESITVWNGESDEVLPLTSDLTITAGSDIIRNNSDPKKASATLLPSELDRGDIVHYETDSLGQVTAMAVRLRANYPVDIEKAIHNGVATTPGADYNYYQLQYLYGTLAHIVTDGIVVNVPISEGGTAIERLYPFKETKPIVVLCDSSKRDVKNIKLSEVRENDKVFVARNLTETLLVVVYR